MENFDWKMIFDGISTLTRALPQNERIRKWVVIGTVMVVGAATVMAVLQTEDKEPLAKAGE